MARGVSDFSKDDRKGVVRERTLGMVRLCPSLWDGGHLLVDWMELSAKKDPAFILLRDGGALTPGRFIGVSREPEVIKFNSEFFRADIEAERALYIQGELGMELFDLDAFPRLGVLVFDGFTSVSNMKLAYQLDPLFRFASARAQRNGQMFLVICMVQRSNRVRNHDQGLQSYRRFLQERLGVDVSDNQLERYKSGGRAFSMLVHRILFTLPSIPIPQPIQNKMAIVTMSGGTP